MALGKRYLLVAVHKQTDGGVQRQFDEILHLV
jgi:hypothetical protein